jgi:hypothetical protein
LCVNNYFNMDVSCVNNFSICPLTPKSGNKTHSVFDLYFIITPLCVTFFCRARFIQLFFDKDTIFLNTQKSTHEKL